MLNQRKLTIASLFAVLIFDIAALYLASQLAFFDSKIMPLVIGGFLLVLTIFALGLEIFRYAKCPVLENDSGQLSKMLLYLLPLFSLVAITYFLGFYIGVFLFVSVYIFTNGGKIVESFGIGSIMGGLIYIIFKVALQVDLAPGIIVEWLQSL